MGLINSCPASNLTSYRCIGDIVVWTDSHTFALAGTLIFSPLIILVGWLWMREK